jgi:hypothetical protein
MFELREQINSAKCQVMCENKKYFAISLQDIYICNIMPDILYIHRIVSI